MPSASFIFFIALTAAFLAQVATGDAAPTLFVCSRPCASNPFEPIADVWATLSSSPTTWNITSIAVNINGTALAALMVPSRSWSFVFVAGDVGETMVRDVALRLPSARVHMLPALTVPRRIIRTSLPSNVKVHELRTDIIGHISAAMICSLQSTVKLFFLADGAGYLARTLRAALHIGISALCPSNVTLHGEFGIRGGVLELSQQRLDEATVLVTFGRNSERIASQLVLQRRNLTSPMVAVLPARLGENLGGAPAVEMHTGRMIDHTAHLDSESYDTTVAQRYMVLGACVPLCDPAAIQPTRAQRTPAFSLASSILAGSLVNTGFNVELGLPSMTLASAESGATAIPVSAVSSTIDSSTVIGSHIFFTVWGYSFVLRHFGPSLVVDGVSASIDYARVALGNVQLPSGAAVATLPQGCVVHGGSVGMSEYTDGLLWLTFEDGVIVGTQAATHGCPATSGHTAVAGSGDLVYLYGGLTSDMDPMESVHVLDLDNASCSAIFNDGNRPSVGRYQHSAALWERRQVIRGVRDSVWMVIAGGYGSASSQLQDVYIFAITARVWIDITPRENQRSSLQAPPLVPFADQLFVVGETTTAFSAGRDAWSGPLTAASTFNQAASELKSSGVTLFGSSSIGVLLMQRTRFGQPTFVLMVVRDRECGDRQVPTPGLAECASCGADRVAEERTCTPCEARHRWSEATYREKEACIDSYEVRGLTGSIIVAVLTIVTAPAVSMMLMIHQRADRARRNQAAAVKLAEAVALLKLEQVSNIGRRKQPTRVERALACVVRSLRHYRQCMPDAALGIADSCNRALIEEKVEGTTVHDMLSDSHSEQELEAPGAFVAAPRERRQSMGMSGTVGRADQLVDFMLRALSCQLGQVTTALAAFCIDDLPKWSNAQRPAALPQRIAKIYDVVLKAVRLTGGVTDSVLGDRIMASWNASAEHETPMEGACLAAYRATHSKILEQLGVSLHAGVSEGTMRAGFVGCEGQDSPPFRRFAIFGQAATDALNLSQAARMMRLPVLVPWAFSNAGQSNTGTTGLSKTFIVRFVTGIRFGNIVSRPLYAGEVMGLRADAALVWDIGQLARQVDLYNELLFNAGQSSESSAERARKTEGMPQRYINTLQHALVSKQLPLETIPRAW